MVVRTLTDSLVHRITTYLKTKTTGEDEWGGAGYGVDTEAYDLLNEVLEESTGSCV